MPPSEVAFPPRRRPDAPLALQVGRCEVYLPEPGANWRALGPASDEGRELENTASPAADPPVRKFGKVWPRLASAADDADDAGDPDVRRALEQKRAVPVLIWTGRYSLPLIVKGGD